MTSHPERIYHPECPDLLQEVMPSLSAELDFRVLQPPRLPSDEELTRIHTNDYVKTVREAFKQVDEGETSVVYLDSETSVGPGTSDSVLRGAGVTLQAVEDVCEDRALRAFVMVRPPGHHAEPHTAMGFCFFNNIMLGLAHAQAKYPDLIKRAALLDFDVHHGNGGQTACFKEPSRMFASTHQSPLFPWKGLSEETGVNFNVINVPLSKDSSPQDFREAWENKILPSVRDFDPDIIFVSAGFDAHESDPLASLRLMESDFGFVTDKIAELANEVAGGRLITVLEGGYDPQALGNCVSEHLRSLSRTSLPSLEQRSRTSSKAVSAAMLFTQDEITSMNKNEVRAHLARLGMPTSGKLDVLKNRLAEVPATAA
eukprot:CAMPEP_0167769468 /NCGR_PEP_ID=MMETSP0110_2-20121227/17319_1 /TAXON_ID=629695 /ORGANISM="Gymnochlora sp., Strain CCMP2014" /LENGTH=370 /DNA_ID=CAMNT_0007658415 /DNA_START=237 /DNA_END=1349 /DNA_ORIENTATION=+